MATVKEIATYLGLSTATVSRALRNDPKLSINPETRTRIQQAVDKLGAPILYKKSVAAETGKTDFTICVIHKNMAFRNQIDSSYYFAIRSGIEEACSKSDVSCIFIPPYELDKNLDFDGYILVGNHRKTDFEKILSLIGNKPLAAIGIISYFPDRVDHITHSNKASVSCAMDYLFSCGHTKIGYLGVIEAPGTEEFESRRQTFIDIMEKKGLYEGCWLKECKHGDDRVLEGYKVMSQWLDSGKELPTAIFCANDPVALGAVKALHEHGINVPKQISIVSHDSGYPTQYAIPPLTTVDVHPYLLGWEGIKAILERMSNERKVTKTVLLNPELIVRDSVARLN